MKTVVITMLLMVFGIQLSFASQSSNGTDQDESPIRIIREIR